MIEMHTVQTGLIDISQEEGVKDSRPTCTYLKVGDFNVLIDTEHPKEDGVEFKQNLARLGLTPEDIHAVVFTHLHPDHIGHKDLFVNATFVFQGNEKFCFYFKKDTCTRMEGSAILELSPEGVKNPKYIDETPDLKTLGDSLYIKLCPGHTIGSTAIFAFINGKVHCFAGDMFLFKEYFDEWKPPGSNWDESQIPQWMEFIRDHAEVIVPGHGEAWEID